MKKRTILALFPLPFLLPFSTFATDRCTLSDPALSLQTYVLKPQTEQIKMYWQKKNGEAYGSLRALLADIDGDGRVQMAMNGGIYDKGYAPLGLYVENSKQKVALNLDSGNGNFFIRPGGVFYVKGERYGIVRLNAFKSITGADFAVQSGPMLIENGVINFRLKPGGESRKIRNGVGVTHKGRVVFMTSQREANLYDFACYAKSRLNVRQMLYLDGTISKMYQKGKGVPRQHYPFVTMITVEKKKALKQ